MAILILTVISPGLKNAKRNGQNIRKKEVLVQ